MKHFALCIFSFFFLSCKKKEENINIGDITKIVYMSKGDGSVFDITGNFYILDNRYKEPGKHSLMMSAKEIELVKQIVLKEEVYKLEDSLKFIKYCKNKGCLSEMIIEYKSGRRQYFIFDNSNYKDNFSNKSYKKIINIQEAFGKIYRSKKIDPETVNVHF